MDEATWLASNDPAAMLTHWMRDWGAHPDGSARHLPGCSSRAASERKLRLFCIACAERSHRGFRYGDEGEAISDPAGTARAWGRALLIDKLSDMAARAGILRCIVGNPFRPVPPLRAYDLGRGCPWLTPTVRQLAEAAYQERLTDGTLDPDRLAVLADALEEASCYDLHILAHLRGRVDRSHYLPWHAAGGPNECQHGYAAGVPCPDCAQVRARIHFRGCWAVDLLLGQS